VGENAAAPHDGRAGGSQGTGPVPTGPNVRRGGEEAVRCAVAVPPTPPYIYIYTYIYIIIKIYIYKDIYI